MQGLSQKLHTVYSTFKKFLHTIRIDERACFAAFSENAQRIVQQHTALDNDARATLLTELPALYVFVDQLVAAMSPLTIQQAAAMYYTDARLVWLYDHASELEKLLQLAVCFCKAAPEPVPIAVSMAAAWLTTCKRTSFLQVAKAKQVEWDFALESQFDFHAAVSAPHLAPRPAGSEVREDHWGRRKSPGP